MENKKITPKRLYNFIVFVDEVIANLENSKSKLRCWNGNGNGKLEYSVKILDDEIKRLKKDLEIFENTDISEVKDNTYSEQFNLMISDKFSGNNN